MIEMMKIGRLVRCSIATVLMAGGLAIATNGALAQTWNPANDFSAVANPDPNNGGVWRYGYETAIGSTFSLDTFEVKQSAAPLDSWSPIDSGGEPDIEHNGTSSTLTAGSQSWAPNSLSLHDGNVGGGFPNVSVVRFVAPGTGTYTVTGSFYPGDTNGTTSNYILVNNTTFFSSIRSGLGTNPFSLSVALGAGGTIDFAVGGTYAFGDTGLLANITASASAPEPDGMRLLIVDAVALLSSFALGARIRLYRLQRPKAKSVPIP